MAGQSSGTPGNRNQGCSVRAPFASFRRAADRNGSARVPRPILFWTTADLETKLFDFQNFYNLHRTHAGLEGRLPEPTVEGSGSPIGLDSYQWQRHCRGLYQTPIAA